MTKCCVRMCSNRSPGENGVKFHRFPFSRPDIVEKWIRNIGKKDWKPSRTSVICSVHFEDHCYEDHYYPPSVKVNVRRLTKEATPTLFHYPLLLKKIDKTYPFSSENKLLLKKRANIIAKRLFEKNDAKSENQTSLESIAKAINEKIDSISKARLTLNLNTEKDSSDRPPSPVKDISATVSDGELNLNTEKDSSGHSPSPVEDISATVSVDEKSPMPLKSNEDPEKTITLKDFKDSLKSLRVLNEEIENFKKKIKNYQKTLKTRQQCIRRLTSRVNFLNKRVEELEEASDFAKKTEKLLETFFSGAALEIVLGMVKPKKKRLYPPALRSFASTFYCLSPKAYRYVYGFFKDGLPKPGAVNRWKHKAQRRRAAEIEEAILQTITGPQPENNENNCTEIETANNNLQFITGSQLENSEDNCTEKETGNNNLQSSITEEVLLISNQLSETQLAIQTLSTSEACDESKVLVTEAFSSDLDELIRSTLSNSCPERSNSESKGYYVVHMENPNSKKRKYNAVELNNHETFDPYASETISQKDVVIMDKNILLEDSCIVIIKSEQVE